ncbi:MAG: restriction endonuclease subunit S [Solirubrobacterales bacterium]
MSLTKHPADIVAESGSPLVASHSGWTRVPLGSVATILNGAAFKSKQFSADTGVPLIRIRDIASRETSMRYVGEYDERYLIRPGELLIGMDGDFNVARWKGPEALLNQRVCRIAPDTMALDLDFLTHLLPGYLRAIHDVTSSTTVKHLSSRDIGNIPIPLPALAEQRRIAAHLEGIEARRKAVAERLRATRAIIDRFRSAVLAAACSGRLTAVWREGHGDAVSDNLVSTASPPASGGAAVPASWAIARIADIGTVQLGGTPSRKRPEFWDGDVAWVSSGEVANCRISSTREAISQEGLANSSAKLYPPGTVLIAMIGEGKTRGQAAILDIEAATNQNAAGILADRQFVDPEYLWRWAVGQYETTRAAGTGGNQPALNKQRVAGLIIPVPPIAEQAEIVRRAAAGLAVADRLAAQIKQVDATLDRVSRATLAKAFRGELVPTEASLAAEEERDFEPAQELLVRALDRKKAGSR